LLPEIHGMCRVGTITPYPLIALDAPKCPQQFGRAVRLLALTPFLSAIDADRRRTGLDKGKLGVSRGRKATGLLREFPAS
jgi:hypothetical protein